MQELESLLCKEGKSLSCYGWGTEAQRVNQPACLHAFSWVTLKHLRVRWHRACQAGGQIYAFACLATHPAFLLSWLDLAGPGWRAPWFLCSLFPSLVQPGHEFKQTQVSAQDGAMGLQGHVPEWLTWVGSWVGSRQGSKSESAANA